MFSVRFVVKLPVLIEVMISRLLMIFLTAWNVVTLLMPV
jgi:hypothetical protein